MPTLIVDYKNKKEEKILHAFLKSLHIEYRTEAEEDEALVKAYKRIKKRNEIPVPFSPAKLKAKK